MTDSYYIDVRGPGVDEEISQDSFSYKKAVARIYTACKDWQADGWEIEYGWASQGNYAACRATKDGLERFIGVEREESE